jgi:hypothetical protein
LEQAVLVALPIQPILQTASPALPVAILHFQFFKLDHLLLVLQELLRPRVGLLLERLC